MPSGEFSFSLAGVTFVIRGADENALDSLGGYYQHYPAQSEVPDVVLEIQADPAFLAPIDDWPPFPAFLVSSKGEHCMELARKDALGTIRSHSDHHFPIHGSFTLNSTTNALESVLRIAASIALPQVDALILHSSAVEWNSKTSIFTGKSEAGKSTISTMLADAFESVTKTSDELLVVKREAGQWNAYVSPFIGSKGLPHGKVSPVQGIHFLQQAPFHKRSALSHKLALKEFMQHILVYSGMPTTANQVLDLALHFTEEVPCYTLAFMKSPSVSEVLGIS